MRFLKPSRRTQSLTARLGRGSGSALTITDKEHLYHISPFPFTFAGEVDNEEGDDEEGGRIRKRSLHVYKGSIKEPYFFGELYLSNLKDLVAKAQRIFTRFFIPLGILFLVLLILYPLFYEFQLFNEVFRKAFAIFSYSVVMQVVLAVFKNTEQLPFKKTVSNPQDIGHVKDLTVDDINHMSDEQAISLVNTALELNAIQRKREEGKALQEKIGEDSTFSEELSDKLARLSLEEEHLKKELNIIVDEINQSKEDSYVQEAEDWLIQTF